jgi:flagellar biosynthesis protein FlhG
LKKPVKEKNAQIVSVGSGKGGVGKSIVASNLALLMAREGKRVILADLDVGGANVNILFGHFKFKATLDDFLDRRISSLNDAAVKLNSLYDLKIIVGAGETLRSANLHYAKKVRLIRELRRMEADVVIVDVGPGTSYHSLDFFLLGDLQLAVTTADPTSVVDVYRFIKLSAIRKALSPFLQRDLITKNIATQEFASIDHVLRAVEQIDQDARTLVDRAIAGFKPCLILNRMSENSKINTRILRSLLKEYIGKDLNILGSIPEDEAVEQSVREFMPVVINAPNSPATASFKKVAKALQLLMRMLPE